MRNEKELKELLISIRDNEWAVPKDVENYEFALELMDNIGSTDPELRDLLILEMLYKMIIEKDLNDEEVKKLLWVMISDKHLFNGIGSFEDDSVFRRAFTVLLIGGVINRHNQSEAKLFTEVEIKKICQELIRYQKQEKDVRGYVEQKGWAHSAAHTGDALREIAQCNELSKSELIEILQGIKNKICINNYVYINNEEERLVGAIVKIIERNILSDEDIINWIKSFENIEKLKQYPLDHYMISNDKNFLAALYFRLKRRNVKKEFLEEIEGVIEKILPVFFK